MEKETKRVLKLAKKIISKENYKKLRKIKDEKDAINLARYLIRLELEMENYLIIDKIRRLDKLSKNHFSASNKSLLIPSKIKHFLVDLKEDEFYKLIKLLKDIKKEIEND